MFKKYYCDLPLINRNSRTNWSCFLSLTSDENEFIGNYSSQDLLNHLLFAVTQAIWDGCSNEFNCHNWFHWDFYHIEFIVVLWKPLVLKFHSLKNWHFLSSQRKLNGTHSYIINMTSLWRRKITILDCLIARSAHSKDAMVS